MRDIVGFEGLYYFDDNYDIYSYDKMAGFRYSKGKLLSVGEDKDGYKMVTLTKNGIQKKYRVHRLIAMTFIPNNDIKRKFVNHIDGNKKNNIPSNLEWCTASENTIHAYKNNLIHNKPIYSHKNGVSLYWNSTKECSETLNLNCSCISSVLRGRSSTYKGYTFTYAGGDD